MKMALFSEKYGYTDSRTVLQFESANDALRMSIYNALYECIGEYESGSAFERICQAIWVEYWHQPIDRFPSRYWEFFPTLKKEILNGEWYEGYNLIDLVIEGASSLAEKIRRQDPYNHSNWVLQPAETRSEYINYVLEREGAGYRIVGGSVAPITNELELDAIDQTVNNGTGASAHIKQSLSLFSKKPDPDYLGSVRESILAAESAAKKIAPAKCNTLADAVDALQKSRDLHKALAEAWKKMFGYTSDEDGIRHAGTGEPVVVDFAFAKYMLVTCSAFVNYLAEEFGQDE